MDYLLRDAQISPSIKVQPRGVWDLHKEYFVVPVVSGLLADSSPAKNPGFIPVYTFIHQ